MTIQERNRLTQFIARNEDPNNTEDLTDEEFIEAVQLLAKSMQGQGIKVKRSYIIGLDGVWSERPGENNGMH